LNFLLTPGSNLRFGGLLIDQGASPTFNIHFPIFGLRSSTQSLQNESDNLTFTESPFPSTIITDDFVLRKYLSLSLGTIRMPYPSPVLLLGDPLSQPTTFILILLDIDDLAGLVYNTTLIYQEGGAQRGFERAFSDG
jgi:hypothetical protein